MNVEAREIAPLCFLCGGIFEKHIPFSEIFVVLRVNEYCMAMSDFENIRFEEFKQVEASQHEVKERIRASFYRTKPGCYAPPRYKVDRIKLSGLTFPPRERHIETS